MCFCLCFDVPVFASILVYLLEINVVFRKPFYYLIPSLVAIVRGIISLMRFVPYCSCLGFGLASDYTDVVLNTVLDIVGVRI